MIRDLRISPVQEVLCVQRLMPVGIHLPSERLLLEILLVDGGVEVNFEVEGSVARERLEMRGVF